MPPDEGQEEASMQLKHLARLTAIVALVLCVTGCATNRYRVPVTSFRDDTQRTIGALREFYQSRNTYEIDLYLNGVAADSTKEVVTKDSSGPTPLGTPTFSPASVAARLNALDLVGAYATRLGALASSDAPSQFRDAASLLGDNLASLDKTFQRLSESDPTASRFISPIASIVGAVGEMVLERRRDALITAGIKRGEGPVNEVLRLVRDDMDKVFSLQLRTGEAERFADLVTAYNRERSKLTYEGRKARLDEIKTAHLARIAAGDSVPAALITSMMDAHAALIELASSPRRPTNFADFNDALELWASRVDYLAGQIRTLIR
jgi:hypothetical protein